MGFRDTTGPGNAGPPVPSIAIPSSVGIVRSTPGAPAVKGTYDPARREDWIYGTRSADFRLWDSDFVRTDAVLKCVTVFACANLLSNAVAEARLRIEQEDGDEWKPATADAARYVQTVLDRPNPKMEDAEFWSLIVFQQCVQGFAVVEKVRASNRPDSLVRELWPLRPDWLSKKTGQREGEPIVWQYAVPGKQRREIPDADLITLPYRHDPQLNRAGFGPVNAAAREIGIDSKLTDFAKIFLDAGGIPPFVMTTEEVIDDTATVQKMQLDWEQKYGGSQAWGKLPFLHSGAKIEKVGDGIGDMAWPDLRGITELKICSAFGVPAGLVQAREALIGGSLTTTESDGDMTYLQRYGAEPLRLRNAAALGRDLMAEFGLSDGFVRYRFRFDTSGILALQEDTDVLHNRVRADLAAKIITIDEARVATGREPLKNGAGDVFVVGFSDMFLRPDELAATAAEVTAPAALPESTNAATTGYRALPAPPAILFKRDLSKLSTAELEIRASFAASIRKDRVRLVSLGTRQFRKFFAEQGSRIAGAFEKADQSFEVRRFAETRSESDIFWHDEQMRLSDVLKRFYGANGEAAFRTTAALLGSEIPWDVTNPRILSLQDELGKRIVRIAERTRRDVIRVIANGTQEGQTIAQIADGIRNLFEQTYAGRAQTVARTETQVAYNRSSILSYQESGVVTQAELLDNPEHDEDYGAADGLTCAERDGLVVDLADVDIHILGEHPNGSLIVTPLITTPLGEG